MLTSASPGRGGGDGAGAGRAQPATGSSATIAKFCSTDSGGALPCSLSAAAAADRKDQRNLAALIMIAASRARARRRRFPASSDAERPAPAGSAALRLLADVDSSFSRNCCWQLRRWTLALGRPAPMLTSASPGRGGGDGAGAAASYRVIGNDRKFRSTDSGGALPRSLSAAEQRLGKISGIWQR